MLPNKIEDILDIPDIPEPTEAELNKWPFVSDDTSMVEWERSMSEELVGILC